MPDKVTVFVPTCSERPSLEDCLISLQAQVPRCLVEVIRDVAPMSAAFNEMLRRCRTPYFVQCDDDMLLRPETVARMVEDIERTPETVAIVAHPLWDVHLRRVICGCKIYRRAAIANVGGWADMQSCEFDQVQHLKNLGYEVQVRWAEARDTCVGDHDPMFTPELAYERYRDLVMKQRRLGHSPWVLDVGREMVGRLLSSSAVGGAVNEETRVDLAALSGIVAGCCADLEAEPGEKDFITRPWSKEYARVALCLGLPIDP